MKASVNKITEGAKLRDTLGRNRVASLSNRDSIGMRLDVIQTQMSSDNVEKLTNIIVIDEDTGWQWLLKFRILSIDGSVVDTQEALERWISTLKPDQVKRVRFLVSPEMTDDIPSNDKAVKGDEMNDSK